MTSEQRQALARRAVACKDWRWMSGQPVIDPHGVRGYVVDTHGPGAWVANRAGVSWLSAEELKRCLPDLTDPATLGCLLALVREHYINVWTYPATDRGWYVSMQTGPASVHRIERRTEVAALVCALEAAS